MSSASLVRVEVPPRPVLTEPLAADLATRFFGPSVTALLHLSHLSFILFLFGPSWVDSTLADFVDWFS